MAAPTSFRSPVCSSSLASFRKPRKDGTMIRKRRWLLLFIGSIFAGLCLFLLTLFITVPPSAHSAPALLQQPTPIAIVHTGHGEMKVYDPQQLKQSIGVWRKTVMQQHTFTATAPALMEKGVPVVPLVAGAFPPGFCLLSYGVSRQRRRGLRGKHRFFHQRSKQ